ncbi:hypothetical protein QEZ54_27280 [Catellatospora sp. KI3]|uniref:hypothetical protein n=1 Tax=Catellatospora sp. KI3 TaxID=3041620 RepID=UPI002482D6BC|nr:hypothetical protein [Catellatospora sp. KI3]MDI1464679.1 hypothetical protein [Catellatospora sp. KI3]
MTAAAISLLMVGVALLSHGLDGYYTVFALVLALGGVLLLWLGATGRPLGWAWAAVGVLTLVGLGVSLVEERTGICCMFGYHRGLGYPWPWLTSHAEADTLAAIEAVAASPQDLSKHVQLRYLLVDAAFWAEAALLLVTPVALLLRRPTRAKPDTVAV